MRTIALAMLLSAALAGTGARAAAPAENAVRAAAAALRSSAPALRVSNDAPQLGEQLAGLAASLDALAREDAARAASAKPVRDAAAALEKKVARAPKPLGNAVCKAVADEVSALAARALRLLPDGASASNPAPYNSKRPDEAAQSARLRQSAAAMARVMGETNFDGAPSVAAVPGLPPSAASAPAPLPLPRGAARQAKPVYSAQVAAYQRALAPFLKSRHLRAIAADGLFGPGTEKAVAAFQKAKALPATGAIDRDTETALLADYQERHSPKLPVTGALDAATSAALARAAKYGGEPRYYAGPPSDFEPDSGKTTITKVLATVYTPFLARSKKARRIEGPPEDRFQQTVCTLERYLGGECPYVSVAIASRLKVPNGTPLMIPGIDALVGRPVQFRIVDTGSTKLFKGPRHIDIATDSNQYGGYGALISGRQFTVVLPHGLHPRL